MKLASITKYWNGILDSDDCVSIISNGSDDYETLKSEGFDLQGGFAVIVQEDGERLAVYDSWTRRLYARSDGIDVVSRIHATQKAKKKYEARNNVSEE